MKRKLLNRIFLRASILKELFSFLWENRLWWMMPVVAVFILLGILIWLAQSPAAAPFIYALF